MTKQMSCRITFFAGLVLVSATAAVAENLRVVTWNVSNYTSGRTAEFQTAVYGVFSGRSMSPDVILGQEFLTTASVPNFVNLLNAAPGSPGDWAGAAFVDGPDTDSAFFYRTSKAQLATDLSPNGVTVVAVGGPAPNHPRNIMRYDIRLSVGTSAEAKLALYSVHMKASTGGSNEARRLLEAQRVRDDAETLPLGWHFLIGGDYNIRSSSWSSYQEMVGSQVNNDGRFFDPISTPGNWNNNSAYRIVHNQDPSGPGGMDDRFDQVLLSASLVDGVGFDYIGEPAIPYSTVTWNDPNHSYRAWGNDGTSYNTSLTITGNQMVGSTIAQALVTASTTGGGHLPVFLDILIPPCPADFECDGDVDLFDHAQFAPCISGPGFVLPTQECRDYFDLDADNDVDMFDFSLFQIAFGG